MGRRYRRRSAASSIISDTVYIGSKLPWWGALTFGLVTFLLFYFVVPACLNPSLQRKSQAGSTLCLKPPSAEESTGLSG